MIANCRYACIVNRGEELSVRIGIDLGGTKTEVIALSDQGEQLFRHRLPTPREDYRQTIETIATLVAMAEHDRTAGYRGDGHSWLNFALYRGGEKRQLDLAQRPAL